MYKAVNHAGRDPLVGKNVCLHRRLRNESEVDPAGITFSGKNRPWGGFYGNVVCPDCGEDFRFFAPMLEVWPSSWRVIDGKPVPPHLLEETLAGRRAEAER